MKTLLVPDRDLAPAPHWIDWWLHRDPRALIVAPLSDEDEPDAWDMQIAGAVIAHPGALIVAHGYGALVAARLLGLCPRLPVTAALLVAPADRAGTPLPEMPLPCPAVLAASSDDPCLGLPEAARSARHWGAQLHVLGAVGRMDAAAGFGPWPEGPALRDRLAGSIQPRPLVSPAPRAA